MELALIAVVFGGAAAIIGAAVRRRYDDVFRRHHAALGLTPDGDGNYAGTADERPLRVEVRFGQGDRGNRTETTCWVCIDSTLPEGLRLSRSMPRPSGDDPGDVDRWWQWAAVADTATRVLNDYGDDAGIEDGWLYVRLHRRAASVEDARRLLRRTRLATLRLEDALRWSPQHEARETPSWCDPWPRPTWPPRVSGAEVADRDTRDLVASLRSEGRRDSSGSFSLDRESARTRLLNSAIAYPERFALDIVQAAVARGARWVDIQGRVDLCISFDGEPFTVDELESLYIDAFADGLDERGRSCRALAYGISAALALEPHTVEVRSGEHTLRVRPGHEDELFSREDDERERTEFVVDASVFGRSWQERTLERLRHDCMFAPVAVTIEHRDVAGGLHIRPSSDPKAKPVADEVAFEAEDMEGRAGFVPELAKSHLAFVLDGVAVAFEELEDYPPEYQVVVASPRFRRDLSRHHIVHDEAWEMAHALAREHLEDAIERMLTPPGGTWREVPPPWQRSVAQTALALVRERSQLERGGRWEFLAAVPAWPAGNPGNGTVPLDTLIHQESPQPLRVNWSIHRDARAALVRLFPEHFG